MQDDAYLQPYQEHQAAHGTGFGVTLWASRKSQELRFRVLAEMCFLPGKRILDAGCSRGDLAAYLIQREIAFERYIGIDGLPEVIDFAKGRNLPGCEFHVADFLRRPESLAIGQPQVIFISGSLNTMSDAQVAGVLEGAWRATQQVLVFNFLSDRHGRAATAQSGPARRLDTMKLLDWALGKTSQVQFRQDYFTHGHDATILMRRP